MLNGFIGGYVFCQGEMKGWGENEKTMLDFLLKYMLGETQRFCWGECTTEISLKAKQNNKQTSFRK
jgi:hypothetical protein